MSKKTIILTLLVVAASLLAGTFGGHLLRPSIEAWRATDMSSQAQTLSLQSLTGGPSAVVAANPEGDVTVIEFFDYQCPVCRRVHPDVQALVAEDSGVRLIHKHWPIFGDGSVYAAKVALAARRQGKYEQVHDRLMRSRGKLDEAKVREIAAAAGVDLHRLDRDLEVHGEEIEAAVADASIQARLLGLPGTPGYLIGRYLVPGGLDLPALKRIVADARAGKDEAPN